MLGLTAARNTCDLSRKGMMVAISNKKFGVAIVFMVSVPFTSHAASVPSGLLGKTINFAYTVSVPTKFPDGNIKTTTRSETRIIYVSTAGRIFMRNARRNSAGNSETLEAGPERATGELRYSDGVIIGTVANLSSAYQFSLTLDPSFQTCSAKMVFAGLEGQVRKWNAIDGQVLEKAGKGSVAASCTVTAGNGLGRV